MHCLCMLAVIHFVQFVLIKGTYTMCLRLETKQKLFSGRGLVSPELPRSHQNLEQIISPGTRWLTRWNKEVELLVKIVYFGLTTGRGDTLILTKSLPV